MTANTLYLCAASSDVLATVKFQHGYIPCWKVTWADDLGGSRRPSTWATATGAMREAERLAGVSVTYWRFHSG